LIFLVISALGWDFVTQRLQMALSSTHVIATKSSQVMGELIAYCKTAVARGTRVASPGQPKIDPRVASEGPADAPD
jgi:hypothetical protein